MWKAAMDSLQHALTNFALFSSALCSASFLFASLTSSSCLALIILLSTFFSFSAFTTLMIAIMLTGSSTNFLPFFWPFGFAMPAGIMPFNFGMSSSASV